MKYLLVALAFVLMLAFVLVGCGSSGAMGPAGRDGDAGAPGEGCTAVSVDGGTTITCGDGPAVFVTNGTPGADGGSCTVTQLAEGALIQCPNGTGAMVYNGTNGRDGADALVEIIDPCGKQSDTDEVFFRFSDGHVYAVYASGDKVHLVRLVPGEWVTTDGTNCRFTFTDDERVTY